MLVPIVLAAFLGQTQPKPLDFTKILGKTRTEVEAVLGTPEKSGSSEEGGYDWAGYKLANSRGIKVLYYARGGGLPKTQSSNFEVSFEKGTLWKKAAQILGMKPTLLKPVPLSNILSMAQLVGDPFKGWNVYYTGNGARYPGDKGELNNEDQGLPMIQFEARSINDDSPDEKL